MTNLSPEFLYIGFILPTLFSLTLVGEGVYQILNKKEGYFTFILGILFLVGVISGYLMFVAK